MQAKGLIESQQEKPVPGAIGLPRRSIVRRPWVSECSVPWATFTREIAWEDMTPRARIQARVLRFSTGNLGDHKSVGGGVWEVRGMFGPGYRIYFGKDGAQLVLLLLGDKSTQTADVARAQESWKAYQEGKPRGKTK